MAYEKRSSSSLSAGDLEQAKVTVRIGDSKFITMLWKSDSSDLGKSSRRSWRGNGWLVTPLPQANGAILRPG